MANDDNVNQYDKTLSYTKLMARPGDIRGLLTKDGWIIWRILNAELTWFDPYRFSTQFQAGGTAVSGQTDLRIWDPNSKEVLYHERKGEVWETFQGYSWPYMRIFQKYNGEKFGRLQKDLGDPLVQTSSSSVFGFTLKGGDSLYRRETGFGRFLIPAYQYTTFDIFNPAGKAVYLDSRYPINKMDVQPFDPEDEKDLKIMMEVLKGRIRKDVWLWGGGLEKYPWSHTSIKKITGVDPLVWNGKVAKVGGKLVYPVGGE